MRRRFSLTQCTNSTLLHAHCLPLSPTSNNSKPGKKCPASDFFPRCCMQKPVPAFPTAHTHSVGFLPFSLQQFRSAPYASASAFSPACLLPLSFFLLPSPPSLSTHYSFSPPSLALSSMYLITVLLINRLIINHQDLLCSLIVSHLNSTLWTPSFKIKSCIRHPAKHRPLL